jgi:hypothetical protein
MNSTLVNISPLCQTLDSGKIFAQWDVNNAVTVDRVCIFSLSSQGVAWFTARGNSMIKGIYKIPEIKHAFFIVSSQNESGETQSLLPQNKKRKEYFEHILKWKGRIDPKEAQSWKLRIVSETEFLEALEQSMSTNQVLPSQSSEPSESLELVAINLVKTSDDSAERKQLGFIENEDVIEVFI